MPGQRLFLSWTQHDSSLVGVFDKLLKENTLVDCTLAAEGQYLKAHKLVLSAASSYFELLFHQESEKNPIIILIDVKFEELKAVVSYMYKGEVEVSEDRCAEFLKVANALQIKGLEGDGITTILRQKNTTTHSINTALTNKTVSSNVCPTADTENHSAESCECENVQSFGKKDEESHLFLNNSLNLPAEGEPLAKMSPLPSCVDQISKAEPEYCGNSLTSSSLRNPCDTGVSTDETWGIKVEPEDIWEEVKSENESEDIQMEEDDESVNEDALRQFYANLGANYEDRQNYFSSAMKTGSGLEEKQNMGSKSEANANYSSGAMFNKAEEGPSNILPLRSKEVYEKEYISFGKWREENRFVGLSEDIVLAYLFEKSQSLKSSTLWSKFSMLKATLNIKENIDIGKYTKVKAYLKKQSINYEAEKTQVLNRDEVNKFLVEAPDELYLMMKVALIFGIAGACRREEIHNICFSNIEDRGSFLVVTVTETRSQNRRTFTLRSDGNIVEPLHFYRKYVALRPKHTNHDKLFIYYKNNKCSIQPVGVHSIGKIPSQVAKFLKIPNPEQYTGRCFRHSSGNL